MPSRPADSKRRRVAFQGQYAPPIISSAACVYAPLGVDD
jgi:hypothetical protein